MKTKAQRCKIYGMQQIQLRGKCLYVKNEVKVKVTQSCPTLCSPMDYTVHGILQPRILEWVAVPVPRGSFQTRDQTQASRIAGGFSPTS